MTTPNATEFHNRLSEVKLELAAKAAQDTDFRNALIASPVSTVESEYGLPEGSLKDLSLRVVEEEPGGILIPIPPDISEMELTDDQLDQVAGGFAFVTTLVVTTVVATTISTAAAVADTAAGINAAGDKNTGRGW